MGVQSLSYHDRGVWWEILCLMHESERRGVLILNGQAMGEDALARLLGLDKQNLTTTLTSLLTSGVASREQETGAIYSRRMVRDEKLRQIRTLSGSKGGNPVLLNQNTTTIDNQKTTPSACVRAEDETEDEEYFKKKEISLDSGSELMLACNLFEELGIVGGNAERSVAAEAIRLLAKEGGTTLNAQQYILQAGKAFIEEGGVIDRFWFTQQRYRPQQPKKTARQKRIEEWEPSE
jgi:hypothetical protein